MFFPATSRIYSLSVEHQITEEFCVSTSISALMFSACLLGRQADTRKWLESVFEETIPHKQSLPDYLMDGVAL